MTTMFIHIGDLAVTVTANPSLDPRNDPMPMHYTVHFRDVATDVQQTISCQTELEAVNLVAAWLVADEKNIGVLEQYRDKLYKAIGNHRAFLP